MGIAKLTAENAVIKTASVEIKTLTVSGRQVTQAVFKQLRSRRLMDPLTLAFNGQLWGYVNYHPDGCGGGSDYSEHLHVVWQSGAELFRSSVPSTPVLSDSPHWDDLQHGINCLCLLRLGADADFRQSYHFSSFGVHVPSALGQGKYDAQTLTGVMDFPHSIANNSTEYRMHLIAKKIAQVFDGCMDGVGMGDVQAFEKAHVWPAVSYHKEWVTKYALQYQKLCDLDQLFIAC